MHVLRLLVPALRNLRVQQPVNELLCLAVAALLVAATAVLVWAVISVGGGWPLTCALLVLHAPVLAVSGVIRLQHHRRSR